MTLPVTPYTGITAGDSIDRAATKLTGTINRTLFLQWFNEIVQDIMRQPRRWKFLDEPQNLVVINNQMSPPAGVVDIYSIQLGTTFFTKKNLLSDEEAAAITNSGLAIYNTAYGIPVPPNQQGYTFDPTNLIVKFYPSVADTTASVVMGIDVTTDYAETDRTIFPHAFYNLFVIGLRMHYYDFTKDGRFEKESTMYQIEMSKVKAWDNRFVAVPKFSKKGYIRGVP